MWISHGKWTYIFLIVYKLTKHLKIEALVFPEVTVDRFYFHIKLSRRKEKKKQKKPVPLPPSKVRQHVPKEFR